jgi:hypothetical protein
MSDMIDFWNIFLLLLGSLLLLDWLFYLPIFSSLFATEENNRFTKASQARCILISVPWLLAIGLLAFGDGILRWAACVFLWLLFRHYFILRRWSTVRRGSGAPGFMSHWTLLWVTMIETARLLDGSGWLVSQVLWAARVDFAVIMICAGTYKAFVGFLSGDGMDYGRVNPYWGYHWRALMKGRPNDLLSRGENFLASIVEIGGGILMLIPYVPAQILGGFLITISFIYVSLFIRLGRLAWLMALLPAIFLPGLLLSAAQSVPVIQLPPAGLILCALPFWIFIALLPLVKISQYLNLFANKRLPDFLQKISDKVANTLPVIIWRVFTPDLTNFFVRVKGVRDQEIVPLATEDVAYNYTNWHNSWIKNRFLHVTESIALVSIFTTLKYFPSRPDLFNEKILRYSASLNASLRVPCDKFLYEYVAIEKTPSAFVHRHVLNYIVDLSSCTVLRESIDPEFDPSKPAKRSPIRESIASGSYLKK